MQPQPALSVWRPHTPVREPGFCDAQLPTLGALLDQLLAEEGLQDYLVWFYTPMALPLLGRLRPRAVVYDCMDELSVFLGAPSQMRAREAELLAIADLVFTGGPSLYLAS